MDLGHECIACGIRSFDDNWKEWHPVRENEPDEYEALCGACAARWMRCECCGDAHPDVDLYTDRIGNKVECEDCIDSCGKHCMVLTDRLDHTEQLALMRADKDDWDRKRAEDARALSAFEAAKAAEALEREDQLSAVRESLRVTLERQAKQN